MPSAFKISISEIAGFCLAIALCVIPVATCGRSARLDAEPVSLASVALILLSSVQRGIGESKSMEVLWVSGEKQWNDLIASAPAEMFDIMPQPAAAPDIDFTKYGVLVIRMGQKPNGGYGLTLTANEARIENREAKIPVRMREPEPGYLYTQAIVYPHLVIKMEKGAFNRIAVVDQNGQVRMRLSIE